MKAQAPTKAAPPPAAPTNRHLIGLFLLGLTAVVWLVFWPALHFDFIRLDDPGYVTANPFVQGGLTWRGLAWAFGAHECNWHPLTWLSHMLDVQLLGQRAFGPHLVNVLLHTANTLLLFLWLARMTGRLWPAAVVAGLFALHPLHVESVAWVSERKDVLSTFFGFLALLAYARYSDQSKVQSLKSKVTGEGRGSRVEGAKPTTDHGRGTADRVFAFRFPFSVFRFPVWSLFFFAVSLMAKPMFVTLPFLLLLLDFWPLRRIEWPLAARTLPQLRRAVREKIPFLLLSAISCVVTFVAQKSGGAVQSFTAFPLTTRLLNAPVACLRYLEKTLWPVGLAVPYPYLLHWPAGLVTLALLAVAGLLTAALWLGPKRPFVFTGTFWFLGMLVPVIGLVQVGEQAMADRYMYVPQVGLLIVLVWGFADAAARWRVPKAAVGALTALALAACAARTRDQVRYWRDSETLFSHAISVTPEDQNYTGYYILGSIFDNQDRLDDAMAAYRRALEIYPRHASAHNNLGTDLLAKGQSDEALWHYREALRVAPESGLAQNNIGAALASRKQYEEAIPYYTAALERAPDYADAHYNLGLALASLGRFDEAIPHYQAALRTSPKAKTYNNLGYALAAKGRLDEAITAYRQAIGLNSNLVEAYSNLGNALSRKGDVSGAMASYRKALALDPNNAPALNNLAYALAHAGRFSEAIPLYQAALRVQSDFAVARANLGDALIALGRWTEAVSLYAEVLRSDAANPKAHYGLACALARSGQAQAALPHLKEALRLKPGYREAQELLQKLESNQTE